MSINDSISSINIFIEYITVTHMHTHTHTEIHTKIKERIERKTEEEESDEMISTNEKLKTKC